MIFILWDIMFIDNYFKGHFNDLRNSFFSFLTPPPTPPPPPPPTHTHIHFPVYIFQYIFAYHKNQTDKQNAVVNLKSLIFPYTNFYA